MTHPRASGRARHSRSFELSVSSVHSWARTIWNTALLSGHYLVWCGVAWLVSWPGLGRAKRENIYWKPNHDIELSHTEIRVDVVTDVARSSSWWMLEISKPLFTYAMTKMGYTQVIIIVIVGYRTPEIGT